MYHLILTTKDRKPKKWNHVPKSNPHKFVVTSHCQKISWIAWITKNEDHFPQWWRHGECHCEGWSKVWGHTAWGIYRQNLHATCIPWRDGPGQWKDLVTCSENCQSSQIWKHHHQGYVQNWWLDRLGFGILYARSSCSFWNGHWMKMWWIFDYFKLMGKLESGGSSCGFTISVGTINLYVFISVVV